MEKLCKNCKINYGVKYSKYSSGDFCCIECAKSFSTKQKRNEINLKVSKTLTGRPSNNKGITIKKICPKCEKEFTVSKSKEKQICCSVICSRNLDSYKKIVSDRRKKTCLNPIERERLKEIGKRGGFGKKGKTKKGVYYQSILEKRVFEYLDEKNVSYIPHKNIPNSSKISDVYLIDLDLWVELDGIDREKKKKWIGNDYDYWLNKLEIYKENNLKLVVVKTFEEFKNTVL